MHIQSKLLSRAQEKKKKGGGGGSSVLRQEVVTACLRGLLFMWNRSVTTPYGARCSSVVRAFAHGAMGRRIDPSWGGPIELCLVPASAPRLV